MTHRPEVVDFIRLYFLKNTRQVGGIRQIAVMQVEFRVAGMWILINMVHTFGIERRGAALDAVNFVTFLQQQFGQIGTILSGYTRNESHFTHDFLFLCLNRAWFN